jgi:hypothetical protein
METLSPPPLSFSPSSLLLTREELGEVCIGPLSVMVGLLLLIALAYLSKRIFVSLSGGKAVNMNAATTHPTPHPLLGLLY